eukprot:TRINITY_DN81421_c0_g1_i1.p1 TRINITY_DN81421_c0_g1~~TRINITY_DN81421_c0_g1_i1.p1  ORF type:complete len:501 (-),score=83.58 TRINITY_DN81421_c0_g1_i1:29-1492(-)
MPLCQLPAHKVALLGPFVDFVGLGTVMPLLAFFVQDAGADEFWVGLILSAQYGGVFIGSLFWGRMSDYCGVRFVYIMLLALDVILFAASAFMTTVEGLLIMRFLAGFVALVPLGVVWISAAAPPDQMTKSFALLIVAVLGGIIAGSAIGGTFGQIKSGIGIGDGGFFSAVAFSAVLVAIALVITVLGTSSPPKQEKGEAPKPEGVRNATTNIEFFAACLTTFLGAQEGQASMVYVNYILPLKYGWSQSAISLLFIVNCSGLLASSIFFAAWLEKRTLPLQRIVLLGFTCCLWMLLHTVLGVSYELAGTWAAGDIVFAGINVTLFIFQCCVGPSAMNIIAVIAATKAKNANGTIMGFQQMIQSVGQVLGPLLGASLLKANLFAPWLYLLSFEVVALVLNSYVFMKARKSGEIQRSLFDLRKIIAPTSSSAPKDEVDAATDVEGTAEESCEALETRAAESKEVDGLPSFQVATTQADVSNAEPSKTVSL